jgi:hypothetical protein
MEDKSLTFRFKLLIKYSPVLGVHA